MLFVSFQRPDSLGVGALGQMPLLFPEHSRKKLPPVLHCISLLQEEVKISEKGGGIFRMLGYPDEKTGYDANSDLHSLRQRVSQDARTTMLLSVCARNIQEKEQCAFETVPGISQVFQQHKMRSKETDKQRGLCLSRDVILYFLFLLAYGQ